MPPEIVYPSVNVMAARVIAGLAAAFLAARFLCPIPPRHPFSSPALIAGALGYVALIAIVAILSTQIFRGQFPVAVRCAAAAIWAAPLVILAIDQSAWAVVPLMALVILATPLFGLNREPPPPSDDLRLLRQLPSSFVIAVCIQAAAVAALIRHEAVAGILLVAAAATLAWRATAIDPQSRSRPRRALVLVTLAILLTVVGMLPYQAVPLAAGSVGKGAGAADSDPSKGPGGDGNVMADSYRGVILLPEVQRHVTLVPPLPALSRDPFRENKKTLEIPFFGVYWFFRRPDSRPPQGAIEMRGTPSALTFRSHDQRPLVMEAHQSLGTSFPLSCCRGVQLAITNRNRFPGTVSIELVLADTFSGPRRFQSLGMLPVQSVFHTSDGGAGISEVLDFPIPGSPTIRTFDEFTIRFHRPFLLARESANVKIDGFTLTPR